jgi:RHS repeat-associated protein
MPRYRLPLSIVFLLACFFSHAQTNLALNKAVTVSSNEVNGSLAPAFAVDGNLTTRWGSAFSDPQWIYVDLGTSQAITRVKVSWSTSANASNYQIQTSTDASVWTDIKVITGNTTLANDHTGLSGTGRYVRIYGTTRNFAFGYSINELEVYGNGTVTAPTTLAATRSSTSQINLSWVDASANETGFEIERSLTSGAGFALVATTAANAVSYSNVGLTADTKYFYRIRAVNAGGGSSYTAEASAVTASPPAAPTTFAAATASSSRINLTWTDASSNETGFQIERSLTTASGFALTATAPANATSYPDAGLSSNTKYYYRIRSTNSAANSAYTAESSATTSVFESATNLALNKAVTVSSNEVNGSLAPAYAVDGDLTTRWGSAFSDPQWIYVDLGSSQSIGRVKITWTNIANASNYQIQVSNDASTWTDIKVVTANSAYVNDNTGLTGTGRYVRVYGTTRNFTFGYSITELEVYGSGAPIAPTTLTAVAASTTQINLTWVDASTNETGFLIERSTTSGTYSGQLGTAAANATTYPDNTVAAGVKYFYRIRSTNASGSSAYTAEVSAVANLVAPTSLTATAASTTQINLTWVDNSANESGYEVYRSATSGGVLALVATTAANATSYPNTGLTAGTQYFYKVRAVNNVPLGSSAYTIEASAATPTAIGVNLALNKTATVSSIQGSNAVTTDPNAVDGNLTTRWGSFFADPQWIYVDLGSSVSIDRVKITWEAASANNYKLQTSNDAVTWTDIKTITSNTVLVNDHTSLGATGRYLRMYGTTRNTVYGYSIYELEVYGPTGTAPAPPTTLAASPASTTQINLTWVDASNNETGFLIERSTTSGTYSGQLGTTAANATTYPDNTVAAGVKYFYRIRSTNASGSSAYTAEVSAVANLVAPTALAATAASTTQINLTWVDNSANESGYEVYRSATSGGVLALVATTAANATSYPNTGLTAGTQYFYKVRAVNNVLLGSSAYTAEATATTTVAGGGMPLPPTTLAATPASTTQINLTWVDASANETGFLIERSTTSGTYSGQLGTVAANVTTYPDNTAAAGVKYFYRIRSTNASGSSVYTAETSAVANLVAPTSLTAVAASTTQINLTWVDNSANETNFTVERSISTGSGFGVISSIVAANSTTYSDNTALPGVKYFYRVRATNNSGTGNSANSAEASAVTNLVAPTGLTANAVSTTQINLTWVDNSANEANFTVERSTSTGSGFGVISSIVAANTVSYSDNTALPGVKYFYRVRATNNSGTGNSANSAEASAVTNLVAPTSLTATTASTTQINLTWADNSINETGYQIERSTSMGAGFAWVFTTAANAVSYSDNAVPFPGVTYFYRVRATNSTLAIFSAYTAEANATTNLVVPTALAATPASSTQVNLEWADNSAIETGFSIERATVSGGPYTNVATTLANVTSYSDMNLSVATQYYYRIKAINASGTSAFTPDSGAKTMTTAEEVLNLWTFQYRYDGRQRMTHKKVPGADWAYMVYDDRDRLVMTQDGEQRKLNKWSFIKYDPLNRPIITGLYTHSAAIDQAAMSGLISTVDFTESYNGDAATHGYNNTVWPLRGAGTDVLTLTYYDNYNFKTLFGSGYDYVSDGLTATANGVSYPLPSAVMPNTKTLGQVTGTKVKMLDSSGTWLKTVSYVDDKYRPVQTISDNTKGGTDRTSMLYDFVGKVLKTTSTHTKSAITWKDPVAVTVTTNSLTGTAWGWGASGAASTEMLAANTDGWLEVTTSETTTYRMIGLSAANADANYASINYALYLATTQFLIYENGSLMPSGWPMAKGDVLRVVRTGTTVQYFQNGVLRYTSAVPSTAALLVDAALYSQGATLNNIKTSFALKSSTIARTFEYDHVGRLLKTWHSLNPAQGGAPVLLSQNIYNELGQLVDKKLHSTDNGSTFKQSVDYRYNIRGWLTSMNNATLSNDGQTNDDTGDLFGMELLYNGQDAGLGNSAQYNGNVSAVKWSNNGGLGAVKQHAYAYAYDAMNRLTGSTFKQQAGTWGALGNGGLNEAAIGYDQNGNILSLTRNDRRASGTMDALAYAYLGNQLLKVTDSGDKNMGFKDGTNLGNDYAYDANGNMTTDRNKDITAIAYNHLNLVAQVTKSSNEQVRYAYDATGRKLRQDHYLVNGMLKKRSDYAGEYFYENDTLKFVNHEEGRIVFSQGGDPEYQYHLKDHLGNVRVTFTSKDETDVANGTLEPANAVAEQSKYLRYANAKMVNSSIFDRTNGAALGYAQRLNGSANEKYGLARSLSVMPGDVISAEVYAKYVDPNSGNWTGALATLVSQVASGTAGVVVDGATYSSSTASFPASYGALQGKTDNGAPKAYLNWLIFDKSFVLVNGGYQQISTAGREYGQDAAHERLASPAITVTQAGYVYIYLSNENTGGAEVYFDDFNVTQVKSPVVEDQFYYAFGMMAESASREGLVKQDFKYNGKELQDEMDLGWLDYGARMYMPDIGRFGSIDPMAEAYRRYSPYVYAIDNPVRYVDYFGLGPGDRVKKARSMKDINYALETNFSLRTSNTSEALKFMDCAEFVCRVIADDKITNGVQHLLPLNLKALFEKNKYSHSMKPKAGDIAIWAGHTGIVTGVDSKTGKFNMSHARGHGKLSKEQLVPISASDYNTSTFYGFYHPSSEDETPPQDAANIEPSTQADTEESSDDEVVGPTIQLKEVTVTGKREDMKKQGLSALTSEGFDLSGWSINSRGGSSSSGEKKKPDADRERAKKSGGGY